MFGLAVFMGEGQRQVLRFDDRDAVVVARDRLVKAMKECDTVVMLEDGYGAEWVFLTVGIWAVCIEDVALAQDGARETEIEVRREQRRFMERRQGDLELRQLYPSSMPPQGGFGNA